jgi:hypothetical protein
MPITPYHFGPSGFIALLLGRRLDVPVFMLVNVVIDIEVIAIILLGLDHPVHRYAHTLLGGAVVGILCGLFSRPLRPLFSRWMRLLHLPYETSLTKAVLSGVLGVWLHVFIDALYHPDVRLAWPSDAMPLWRITSHALPEYRVEHLCVLFFPAAVVLYMIIMAVQEKRQPS